MSIIVGRTTLIIAHRLSTIRHAHKIIVMHKGKLVEQGDHESLMRLGGVYHDLVEQQNLLKAEEEAQITRELKQVAAANKLEDIAADFSRRRASTIISITPSIKAALFGKRRISASSKNAVDDGNIEVKKFRTIE